MLGRPAQAGGRGSPLAPIARAAVPTPAASKPLRIALVLHDLAGGGSERVALGLAGEWAKSAEVHLLLGSRDGPLAVPPGVTAQVLQPEIPRGPGSRLRLALALATEVDRVAPDIIFLPGNWHLLLASGLARAKARPPIFAKISNPPLPGNPLVRPFAALVFRALASPVRHLVAWPPAIAREVAALAPKTPVSAIANPPVEAMAAHRNRAAPTGRVVAVGRLVRQKDMGLAIETLALAARSRPLRLEILGDGPERARLERKAKGLPVTFHGHVLDIAPRLAGADALLLTSRFEGTPSVLLEALAAGVPVIATDSAPFVRELLEGHPARGRLVARRHARALAAALLDRLQDPQPVGDISGLLHIHHPEAIARRWLDLFHAELARPALLASGGSAELPNSTQ